MLLDKAISEVQQILGWRSDKVAEITAALQYAQDEREKPGMTFPEWLRNPGTSAVITTVAGTLAYSIPADYIQDSEERDGNIYYFTGASIASRTVFLKKRSYEDAQQIFFGVWPNDDGNPLDQTAAIPPGIPTDYVLSGSLIFLYPPPDAAYGLRWKYWAKAATQTLGQTNAWLTNAPWVLIGDSAKKLGADLGNANAVQTASGVLAAAEANLFRSVISRQEAGRKRSMGSRL